MEKNLDGTLKISTTTCQIDDVTKLIWAIGRVPATETLNLDKIDVKHKNGVILVDEFQNTSKQNVYALGDVCGRFLLTPGI